MPGFDLAKEALIASGVESENEINDYLKKIENLSQRIRDEIEISDEIQTAKAIFDWLWRTKSNHYQSGGNYRLHKVIDAQLIPGSEPVGNCLGLTLLYNILAKKFGLRVGAVHLDKAFNIGPHVLSILYAEQRTIEIENIFPHGFGYKEHLGDPSRQEWGDEELVIDIYHSRENEQ